MKKKLLNPLCFRQSVSDLHHEADRRAASLRRRPRQRGPARDQTLQEADPRRCVER